MRRISLVISRIRSLFTSGTRDADLDEEIRAHIEMAAEEYVARGMSPEAAARAARRDFGGVDQVKERHREARGLVWLEEQVRNARLAVRSLWKRPGFAFAAVLSLAVGIGAVAAMFTLVDSVLIEPLPFPDQGELVSVSHQAPGLELADAGVSVAMYLAYRDEAQAFRDIGLWNDEQVTVTGLDSPERVVARSVTPGLLPLLGVAPAEGRVFSEGDGLVGAPATAMLGYTYWRLRFSGDPAVIGRSIRVDGRVREIIGIVPDGFAIARTDPEIYVPVQINPASLPNWGIFTYHAIGRLAPGVSVADASLDVARMLPISIERYGDQISLERLEEVQFGPTVQPLRDSILGDVAAVLWVLLGTAGIVLVTACSNVANLLMVRAEERRREVAVRAAMGADPGRIAGQFLVEGLTIGLLGGAVGLAVAFAGVGAIVRMAPDALPRLGEIAPDASVLALTAIVSALSGVLCGVLPLRGNLSGDSAGLIREGGRGAGSTRTGRRTRHGLVVAQMAMAVVLLSGSGLMLRSLQSLRQVNPGFADPDEVMTFRVAVPSAEIPDPVERAVAYEEIWSRLAALPEVASVGAASSLTMDVSNSNYGVVLPEETGPTDNLPPAPRWKWITGDYFRTLRNPVVAGRPIDWTDVRDGARVVVITENLARDVWGSPETALGRRLRTQREEPRIWYEVVGVVGDIRDDGVGLPPTPTVFWPMTEAGVDGLSARPALTFALRWDRQIPPGVLSSIQQAVWSVNPNLPISDVRTLDAILAESTSWASFTLVVLLAAASAALVLGILGIYGVVSYVVSRRTREIGLRVALGADHRRVNRLVIGQGMGLSVVGVAVGLLAAIGLTRLMRSFLYGVEPGDPLVLGGAAVILIGVSFAAIYVPARRATRIEPTEALQAE